MKYTGDELELFQHATNWKRYWSGVVKPQVRGDVLDVGCGLGVNAAYVMNDQVRSYTFLEPDGGLLEQVPLRSSLPAFLPTHLVHGTTSAITGGQYDTLLYIDVLEHIEDAGAELARARTLLRPGGHLIILVPAFQFLYSPFDRAIGHVRRYNKPMLRAQIPSEMCTTSMKYLDSAGLLLSLGNKLLLRRGAPTWGQIAFWDKRIVPLARGLDPLIGHAFGRSLVAVLQKA